MYYKSVIRGSLLVYTSLVYIKDIVRFVLFVELLKAFYLYEVIRVINCYRSCFAILDVLLDFELFLEPSKLAS